MTDAKKLEADRRAPTVDSARLIEAEAVDTHSDPAVGIFSGQPTGLKAPSQGGRRSKTLLRRIALHMLVFFLIGVVMFAVGAGLALALFNGALDQYTVVVKAWVHEARDILQHLLKSS
ncbi:MAG: hypothetical protein FJ146_13445 [Deltaproteobacteria bacterium]|nr:hypothetical protein [Deltaproteobacteria bacterium]